MEIPAYELMGNLWATILKAACNPSLLPCVQVSSCLVMRFSEQRCNKYFMMMCLFASFISDELIYTLVIKHKINNVDSIQ